MEKKPSKKEIKKPLKRGRKIKKILDPSTPVKERNNKKKEDNSAVILRLPVDPTKLKNIKKESFQKEDIETSSESEGMFKNDIPVDKNCRKCLKQEKTISLLKAKIEKYNQKNKEAQTNKFYYNKINIVFSESGKKIKIKKTPIKCWWDTYSFDSTPCFLPELFHNNTYYVIGCFCSFNCALSYNLYYLKDSKIYQRKSLAFKLFRELHGLNADDNVDIKEAPPKEILKDYGGDPKVTIEYYRKNFIDLNREVLVCIPPIKPITTVMEERYGEIENDNKYILKRSKPLSSKNSVVSSMKIVVNDDSD